MDERTLTHWVALRHGPVSLDEAVGFVSHDGAGALAVFVGVVRVENEGRTVSTLEYSAYAQMAVKEMGRIAAELAADLPGTRVAALHRLGLLRVGDIAIVCAASSPHRHEAFVASRQLIDRIKSRVPIWKRETGPDGAAWVGWVDARCEPDHGAHGHAHDHPHHLHRKD
jgi:molybdopterin synthase catalytic subunit